MPPVNAPYMMALIVSSLALEASNNIFTITLIPHISSVAMAIADIVSKGVNAVNAGNPSHFITYVQIRANTSVTTFAYATFIKSTKLL